MATFERTKNERGILFKDARIIFRNFRGIVNDFNRAGEKTFDVVIDSPEDAQRLSDMVGFNVKIKPPRREGDEPLYHLKVKVSYKYKKPRIRLVTSRGIRELSEETIGMLDTITFAKCDLIVNPSNWNTSVGSGVSAYLQSMVVTQEEDELDAMYADDYGYEDE